MPVDKAFFDTNYLIYMFSNDEKEKHNIAIKQFTNYDRIISTQVLNDFCNVCIRKVKMDLIRLETVLSEILLYTKISIVNIYTVKLALFIHSKYHYSYYDSLIIASAFENQCDYLITEDMADGQVIEKRLTIRNIFNYSNIV
jgi:predicted nucleic acid-binding protein